MPNPGLCQRRHWPDPLYESYRSTAGYSCVVRVNHREYQTETEYDNEPLARENAAMRAYMICRNFSVSDGMYPAGHKVAVPQGLPVAIGTGRHSSYSEGSGGSSGSSSPRSIDSERERAPPRSRGMRTQRALRYGYGYAN